MIKKKMLLFLLSLSLMLFSIECDFLGKRIYMHGGPTETIDLSEYLKEQQTTTPTDQTTPSQIEKSLGETLVEKYMKTTTLTIIDGVITNVTLGFENATMQKIKDMQTKKTAFVHTHTSGGNGHIMNIQNIINSAISAGTFFTTYCNKMKVYIKEIYMKEKLSGTDTYIQHLDESIAQQKAIIDKAAEDLDAYIKANP